MVNDGQITIKQPTTNANHKFCLLFHVTLAVYHIAPEAEVCINMLNNSNPSMINVIHKIVIRKLLKWKRDDKYKHHITRRVGLSLEYRKGLAARNNICFSDIMAPFEISYNKRLDWPIIELFKVVAIPERKYIYWIDYECRKLATLRVSIKYGDKNKI
jgi:hypothetical protein